MASHASSGDPPIHFFAHQARSGVAGAREDFEQMIALLVSAVYQPARLVYAHPGDWGIDALVGDLNGRVVIWQAKYFMPGVDSDSHRKQIKKSFESAVSHARAHDYDISEWVLCIPSSMTGPVTQWWDDWRTTQEQSHGVQITLWDETLLRRELLKAEAADVRRHYYGTSNKPADIPLTVRPAAISEASPPADAPWNAGDEVRIAGSRYLIHAEPTAQFANDRAWVWRGATADRIDGQPKRVRVRQFHVLRPTQPALSYRDQVRRQGIFLQASSGQHGVPGFDSMPADSDRVTIITASPLGPTWRERFYGAGAVGSKLITLAALSAAAEIGDTLKQLHAAGTSHRELGPDSIVLPSHGPAALTDAGSAFLTWDHPADSTKDTYDLASLLYRTLTGYSPAGRASPPIRQSLDWFPESLDDLLRSCLDPDPHHRPRQISVLLSSLQAGKRELSKRGAS